MCHSFKFLCRTVHSKPPIIDFVIVACTFFDNLSWNSCIHAWLSFHCKAVKLYVYCIWCDSLSAVRYEQVPKSRCYCLWQLNKERQAKRTKQTRNVQDDRIFTGKRKTSTNLNKHTTDAKTTPTFTKSFSFLNRVNILIFKKKWAIIWNY